MRRVFFGLFIIVVLLMGTAAAQTPSTSEPPTSTPTITPTPIPIPVFAITPDPNGIEGNLSNNQPAVRYTFPGEEGASVTIQMTTTSGDLDPLLLLFDPTGQQIAFNDDLQVATRDAQIMTTLPADGVYTIEATRFQQAQGRTSGTYRLVLTVAGMSVPGGDPSDPLGIPPDFGVNFELIAYQQTQAGTLDEAASQRYYAFGGRQGDLVTVTIARTSGNLLPRLNILNSGLAVISQQGQSRENETVAYVTLPETGWYLIEARRDSGAGSYSLYVQGLAGEVLQIGQPTVSGELTTAVPVDSYIFNAHIDDQVNISLTEAGTSARITLLDLSLRPIAESTSDGVDSALLRTDIPRSGVYILQITGDIGGYQLTLSGIPVNVNKLPIKPATYNDSYVGVINNATPVDYYRFSGKAGELITLELRSAGSSLVRGLLPGAGNLDSYLILTDSQLNELAFNDNAGNTTDARISQFALPADGDYYILVTRSGLEMGDTFGSYQLAINAGAISLQTGALTVTLEWASDADLNLFVRDPSNRIVSWSNPQIPGGTTLQIDSNTGCDTLSDQPVEHIYTPQAAPGEYRIQVWYQEVCRRAEPAQFTLTAAVNGETVLDVRPPPILPTPSPRQPPTLTTLRPGERFDAIIRVNADGSVVILETGRIISPNPQQTASEGGDITISYGRNIQGTLDNEVYARFYQFSGRAGETVVITVQRLTGDLDPIIVLRDAVDNNLALNDDADGTTHDSRLVFTLPEDGLYVIAVTRFGLRDGTTLGDFRLTLERQQ